MEPVEDVIGPEPPSSNAKTLRDEQAAQVRAARFLRGNRRISRPRMPSSFCSAVRSPRVVTHPLMAASCPQYAPIRCTSSSSVPSARLWASDVRRRMFAMANRVGMVRREDDHVRRSARVANSVRRDSSACAARSLESSADGRRRCVADVRDASTLLMLVAPRLGRRPRSSST
jgi:hypothetical protein